MAPQASLASSNPMVQPSAISSPASADAGHKPWIPVTLMIFLGLCLAYTLSYVLYRIVMARRRESEDDMPDTPDRGVSQFMNGARLTLNFGHNPKSAPALDATPNIPEEEKPLTDPLHPAHPEIPTSSPAESPSTPFIILMPSFNIHSNQEIGENRELGEAQLQEKKSPTEAPPSIPSPGPTPVQQPLSQRIAAKVKFLSKDRAEAIALDPKLAPVQGPLRPLSMVPSPPRKKRATLFGLGLKHSREGHAEDPETGSEAR